MNYFLLSEEERTRVVKLQVKWLNVLSLEIGRPVALVLNLRTGKLGVNLCPSIWRSIDARGTILVPHRRLKARCWRVDPGSRSLGRDANCISREIKRTRKDVLTIRADARRRARLNRQGAVSRTFIDHHGKPKWAVER